MNEKILEEFDKLPIFLVPIIEGVDSVRTFVVDVQIVKDFLISKIKEARTEENERVLAIIEKKDMSMYEQGDDQVQFNCGYKFAKADILSSLDNPTDKE